MPTSVSTALFIAVLGYAVVGIEATKSAKISALPKVILDNEFHERSFGFRHGRSAHDALRVVEQKIEEGYPISQVTFVQRPVRRRRFMAKTW